MRAYCWRQLKQAVAYSMSGGQALHLHRFIMSKYAPACFKRAVARGEVIAHLFDQDYDRLVSTVKRVGVNVIQVEHEGTPEQHVDLCGAPLRQLLSQLGE